jgi:HK97 family phage portal protein
MNALALINKIALSVAKATEGAFRPGPYYLPLTGGWLPDGAPLNFWQCEIDPQGSGARSAMVEACVSAYSQTVAMCPGNHWRSNSKGGRDRVDNSALMRIMRHPNDYQSISDFMLNAVRALYLEGNAYALALRNSRFEIDSLHLMDSRQSFPQVAVTGDVFYTLAGNEIIQRRLDESGGPFAGAKLIVPQRDVLHIHLHNDRRKPFPIRGESPLLAALTEMAATDAIRRQQLQFYSNQARPSAVLSTDQVMTRPQVDELRQMWNEQAKGLDGCGPGGVPILTAGLKVQPWGIAGKDAQVAEIMKLNADQIALAFRIPLQILGLASTAYQSTEALMQLWIASGLGFALNHIEESFGLLFQLKGVPDEYLELDTAALLRSMFKDRIEGLARAVQGGILAPNEARNLEGYDDVKFGDEPRVQQQVVPLSAAAAIPVKPPGAPGSGAHPPPAPGPGAPPSAAGETDQPKDYDDNVRRNIARSLIASADEHRRRRAALRSL